MPKYHIDWQKTYYETGEFEVEADSEEEARTLGLERMKNVDNDNGNYYADDKDMVDVSEVTA